MASDIFNFMLDNAAAQAAAFVVVETHGEWHVINQRASDKLVLICASESLANVVADSLNGVSIP